MTNVLRIMIYLPTTLVSIWILVMTVWKYRQRRMARNLILAVAMLLGWQLSLLCYNLFSSPAMIYALYDTDLPFAGFLVFFVFLFVQKFYGVEYFSSWEERLVLCVIPIITTVLVLTSNLHTFLWVNAEIVSIEPLHQIRGTRGVWFWVLIGYTYSLVVCTFITTLLQHKKLPPMYRGASRPLMFGLLISLVGNLAVLISAGRSPIDYSLLLAAVCCALLYDAMKNTNGVDYLNYMRRQTYHALNKGIIILDDEQTIISLNHTAEAWLSELALRDMKGKPYDEILAVLSSTAHYAEECTEEGSGVDYGLTLPSGPQICNLREKVIEDKRQQAIGKFVILENMTDNRALIHRLEIVAGQDPLTGLYNRRKMDEFQTWLDRPESYPLAVIYADINGLKAINDTQGHQEGDVLLRTVAEALHNVCPPSAYLGRIGGDEFEILVPNYTEKQTTVLIAGFRNQCTRVSTPQLPVSASFGFAVKGKSAEDFAALIRLADARMYADKDAWRQKNGYVRGVPMRDVVRHPKKKKHFVQ